VSNLKPLVLAELFAAANTADRSVADELSMYLIGLFWTNTAMLWRTLTR
jgi:hypothetical protein